MGDKIDQRNEIQMQTAHLAKMTHHELMAEFRKNPNYLKDYVEAFKKHYSKSQGGNELAGQELMLENFGQPKKVQQLYKDNPEWIPKVTLSEEDKARHDYFGPKHGWFYYGDRRNQVTSSELLLNILTKDGEKGRESVVKAAELFQVDPRGIAAAILAEGYVNLNTVKSWRPNLPGYGSLHPEAIRSMTKSLDLNDKQISNIKELPETAIPLIAQDMNVKANIYGRISGVDIRRNPEMLAWAYNTSMSNVLESAVEKARNIANCELATLDLTANKQLASPLDWHGVGMGAMAHAFLEMPEISSLQKTTPTPTLLDNLKNGVIHPYHDVLVKGKDGSQDQKAANIRDEIQAAVDALPKTVLGKRTQLEPISEGGKYSSLSENTPEQGQPKTPINSEQPLFNSNGIRGFNMSALNASVSEQQAIDQKVTPPVEAPATPFVKPVDLAALWAESIKVGQALDGVQTYHERHSKL